MEEPELYIEKITINEVRHLKDVEIRISNKERKHLILTGKNGSGKTSVLDYLNIGLNKIIEDAENKTDEVIEITVAKKGERKFSSPFVRSSSGLLRSIFVNGDFILAFFQAKRFISLNVPQGIKKFTFNKYYSSQDSIAPNFLQHIVNLKADRSFARDDNDIQIIKEVDTWFEEFEKALKFLFDDKQLKLLFDRKDYNFNIVLENNQTMPFNALSDGYSAILNIVMELMLRMEGKVKNVYDIQGIVLIDEIETHLHIDLQKKILPFLTSFFPKIQFIVSTHSPFVINSLSNAVVYDLEQHIRMEDLSDYPIDGIVEGYLENDKYSNELKKKIKEYESLALGDDLTEEQESRLYKLNVELRQIPEKLAPELRLQFLQIEMQRRAKVHG